MDFEERLEQRVRDLIEGEDPFVIPIEAERLIHDVQQKDPGALRQWLAVQTIGLVGQRMQQMLASTRQRAFRQAERRVWGEALKARDPEVLRTKLFNQRFPVDEENTWTPLAQMNGRDCHFVAASYRHQGKALLTMAAFMDSLAKKVGDREVAEVMDEETAGRLLASIGGSQLVEALENGELVPTS